MPQKCNVFNSSLNHITMGRVSQKEMFTIKGLKEQDNENIKKTVENLKAEGSTVEQLLRMQGHNDKYLQTEQRKGFACKLQVIFREAILIRLEQLKN